MSGQFSHAQVEALLRPIRPHRVLKAQGQSHVAAFDVIAHLNRLFGFGGWDKEILDLDLVGERAEDVEKNGKTRRGYWVTYRCVMRLTVRDPFGRPVCRIEDAATGSASNMPDYGDAHDFAVKNAVSYALKRCAKDLGDQFGLSLYNGGKTDALVGKTLVMPSTTGVPVPVEDVEEHAPEPVSLGNDERQEPDENDGVGQGLPASGGDGGSEPEPAAAPTPAPSPDADLRGEVEALRKEMTAGQKAQVRTFMAAEGIRSLSAADDDQLAALWIECQRVLAEGATA